MIPYGEGFNDSDHTQRDANPVGGNINTGSGGKRYIKFSIDNETIKQAFSANVTFRNRMLGRVAKMRTNLMTNANPLQTISITNNNPETYPNFVSNGEDWYIISVKNVIG